MTVTGITRDIGSQSTLALVRQIEKKDLGMEGTNGEEYNVDYFIYIENYCQPTYFDEYICLTSD